MPMAVDLWTRAFANPLHIDADSRTRSADPGLSKCLTAALTFSAITKQVTGPAGGFAAFALYDPVIVGGTNASNGLFTVVGLDGASGYLVLGRDAPRVAAAIYTVLRDCKIRGMASIRADFSRCPGGVALMPLAPSSFFVPHPDPLIAIMGRGFFPRKWVAVSTVSGCRYSKNTAIALIKNDKRRCIHCIHSNRRPSYAPVMRPHIRARTHMGLPWIQWIQWIQRLKS